MLSGAASDWGISLPNSGHTEARVGSFVVVDKGNVLTPSLCWLFPSLIFFSLPNTR